MVFSQTKRTWFLVHCNLSGLCNLDLLNKQKGCALTKSCRNIHAMEGDWGHNAICLAYMHHAMIMLLHSMYDYSMLDVLASIPIWLYYIPFLLFAILLPCIWHVSFVHAGFSLCNALCHSSFYHYSYSVLPLFLLRHAIIASSMLTAIKHPDGASLVQTNLLVTKSGSPSPSPNRRKAELRI